MDISPGRAIAYLRRMGAEIPDWLRQKEEQLEEPKDEELREEFVGTLTSVVKTEDSPIIVRLNFRFKESVNVNGRHNNIHDMWSVDVPERMIHGKCHVNEVYHVKIYARSGGVFLKPTKYEYWRDSSNRVSFNFQYDEV